MRYLRMISSINHWDKNKMDLYPNCFSTGDILFSELKTEKNTLSIWGFNDDTEIDDLVVAIALSRQHIQKLVYVIMDDEKINKLGIPLVPERGDADGMVNEAILNKHVNLAKIDFWRLGYVADYLCDLVKEDNTHNTVTEKRLFALIKDSVNAGTVVVDQMSDAMRTSYQNHLKEEAEKAARAAARNVLKKQMPKLPEGNCQGAGTWRPVKALIQTFAHLSARMDRSWSMRRMGYYQLIDNRL